MKLGVFSVLLSAKPVEEAIKYLSDLGVQGIEIGTGGYPGNAHLNLEQYINDDSKVAWLKDILQKNNMEISALSCHGNPVHPNKEIAQAANDIFEKTVIVAEKLGVDKVVTFSGCPGDHAGAKYPNWVTCAWPEDYLEILKYQWDDVLIPYWDKAAKFSEQHGVKICLEMHPGFAVYNPESLLKLRAAVGKTVGANFDPSHLFWQGIDPVPAIKKMGEAIHYFHAKDTKVDAFNTAVNGVLDVKSYGDELNRSWIFRTIGYGHSYEVWNDIFSALKMIGYDGFVSIEHEDSLMSIEEGLKKAIAFLKQSIIFEKSGAMWWA